MRRVPVWQWLKVVALFNLAMAFCVNSTMSLAAAKVIKFNMTDTGYPPFLIHGDHSRPPSGLMYDILQQVLKAHGFLIKTTRIPKNRELLSIEQGELDAQATAIEWVPMPHKYVFTDPVLKVRNVIYSKANEPVKFSIISDLYGKKAITHLGFIYPPLTKFFRDGSIERIDSLNELSMLKMVRASRGDFAIINSVLGGWLIKQHNLTGQFVASETAVTNFDYRIMFSQKWRSLVPKFNRELSQMRQNGSLDTIFMRYGIAE